MIGVEAAPREPIRGEMVISAIRTRGRITSMIRSTPNRVHSLSAPVFWIFNFPTLQIKPPHKYITSHQQPDSPMHPVLLVDGTIDLYKKSKVSNITRKVISGQYDQADFITESVTHSG